VEALSAGADLLLVACDGAQLYRLFVCASDAAGRDALDVVMPGDGAVRLGRALVVD
jgi:beta-N-acetylhexosaminidase